MRDDSIIPILAQLLREHWPQRGSSLLTDATLMRNLLADYAPEQRAERNLLVMAVQEQVPQELAQNRANGVLVAGRLAKRLEDHLGIAPENAYWAVGAWAQALGVKGILLSFSGPLPTSSPRYSQNSKSTSAPVSAMKNTPEWDSALKAIRDRQSVFVTGKAGTGKSTLLRSLAGHLPARSDGTALNAVCLAPTGVAATNIGGMTIHRFFRFPPHWIDLETVDEIAKKQARDGSVWRTLDVIIIDEVSMVRVEMLENIDRFLKRVRANERPFGGVQMIFFGDVFQLPPVVGSKEEEKMLERYASNWFFSAPAFARLQPCVVELQQVFRQRDPRFIALLNAVRSNKLTPEQLDLINRRVGVLINQSLDHILVACTNQVVLRENERRFSELKTPVSTCEAVVMGDFPDTQYPTERILKLRVGAKVMFIRNNGDTWNNGTLGEITRLEDAGTVDRTFEARSGDWFTASVPQKLIEVKLADGRIVNVDLELWEAIQYEYDAAKDRLEAKVVGVFVQYPLKLAWAVTIHKAQGLTFENVTIDWGSGAFAHGQAYVALSRSRTLEGISMRSRLKPSDVRVDRAVIEFARVSGMVLS